MIQSLNENHFKSFNDLGGNILLKRISRNLNNMDMNVEVVTVVSDRYVKKFSIKSSERKYRRGTNDTVTAIVIQRNGVLPNY